MPAGWCPVVVHHENLDNIGKKEVATTAIMVQWPVFAKSQLCLEANVLSAVTQWNDQAFTAKQNVEMWSARHAVYKQFMDSGAGASAGQ